MNFNNCQTRKVKPPKPGGYKANRIAEIRKRVTIVTVLVLIVGSLIVGAYYLRVSNERNYADALRFLQARNYTAAEEKFSHVHGYRDANALKTYCKYAAMYRDRTTYKDGHDMLRFCTLQYETEWQDDIDELSDRIEKYYLISQEHPKTTYKKPSSSTKPSTSQFTSKPSSTTKPSTSQSTSKPSSSGTSSGTYNSRYGQTFNYGGNGGTHSTLRDDYDNPEDLYEDNKDWYEDEDEAWDEYYDDY